MRRCHSLCHKCLGEHVCERIHTARARLRQHLRFPPMFNLAEGVGGADHTVRAV